MKAFVLLISVAFLTVSSPVSTGYKVGDTAMGFNLKNIDGKYVSLSDYAGEKGVIVIFTCNTCPYSVLYEDRINELDAKYSDKGYPVVAIQPNDPARSPGDSFEEMKKRADEKSFSFPYLMDETQEITSTYGATNTPHVYLLSNKGESFEVAYIGAIDNNSRDASQVTEKYVENAIANLNQGEKVGVDKTKAIGCTIKWKR